MRDSLLWFCVSLDFIICLFTKRKDQITPYTTFISFIGSKNLFRITLLSSFLTWVRFVLTENYLNIFSHPWYREFVFASKTGSPYSSSGGACVVGRPSGSDVTRILKPRRDARRVVVYKIPVFVHNVVYMTVSGASVVTLSWGSRPCVHFLSQHKQILPPWHFKPQCNGKKVEVEINFHLHWCLRLPVVSSRHSLRHKWHSN